MIALLGMYEQFQYTIALKFTRYPISAAITVRFLYYTGLTYFKCHGNHVKFALNAHLVFEANEQELWTLRKLFDLPGTS